MPSLPISPGVYWFEGDKADVLYIGKAKNLRSRLRSYHLKANQIGKTKRLLDATHSLRFALVESELQALILEAHLIHTFTPKYNIRLKDDRSPLYIIITDEEFPRVLTTHKSAISHMPYAIRHSFGPFPSGLKTKLVLKLVRRVFPFCNASPRDKLRHTACFYSHIGLCPGACTGCISRRSYLWLIRQLAQFLQGNAAQVTKALEAKMRSSAKNHHYEAAAAYRDRLEILENLKQKAFPRTEVDELQSEVVGHSQLQVAQKTFALTGLPLRIEGYDIANLYGHYSVGSLVVFEKGRPASQHYRYFKIKSTKGPNDPASLAETLSRRLRHSEWETPDLIVIDGGKAQVNAVTKVINNHMLSAISHKLDWDKVPVVGLAKREELLILSQARNVGRSGNRRRGVDISSRRETSAERKRSVDILKNETLRLSRRSPALKLVQSVRDEAHRFARTLYHKLQQKALIKT